MTPFTYKVVTIHGAVLFTGCSYGEAHAALRKAREPAKLIREHPEEGTFTKANNFSRYPEPVPLTQESALARLRELFPGRGVSIIRNSQWTQHAGGHGSSRDTWEAFQHPPFGRNGECIMGTGLTAEEAIAMLLARSEGAPAERASMTDPSSEWGDVPIP